MLTQSVRQLAGFIASKPDNRKMLDDRQDKEDISIHMVKASTYSTMEFRFVVDLPRRDT